MSGAGHAGTRWFGTWCVATLCWGGFGAPVLAGEFAFGAGYSLAYDSNIKRVPIAVDEITQTLMSGFAYQERTANLSARLLAQVERSDYLRKTFTGDKAFFVDGAGVWTIVPKQFAWTMEDVARQARIDITAPDTPSNRTNVNFLSTGPDFTFRLPANAVAIGARYGRFDIARVSGSNERYSGYARGLHPVSEQTTLSANYEATRVNFQDPSSFNDFLREDWFLRYETRPSLSSLAIDAGTSRVTRVGTQDLKGRLARLTFSRQLTSESSLQMLLVSQYSDSGGDLLGAVTSATQSTGAAPSTSSAIEVTEDVYYSERGDLTYTNEDGIFGYTLRGYARRVDYQQLPRDYHEYGGRFALTWLLSGGAQVRAYTEYLKRIFRDFDPSTGKNFDQQDTERTTSLGVTYRLTRNVNVTVEGARLERASTEPSNNFVDWRAMLLLGYSTGPLYAVQSRR